MRKNIHVLAKIGLLGFLALLLYYSMWIILDGDLRYFWPFSFGEMLIDYCICFLISLVVSIFYWKSYTRIQRERDRFKLKSLENQINPHFVFNNFSILSSLIEEDPQQAQIFLMNLSKVYRYSLNNSEKDIVHIKDELSFLDQYTNILKNRFGDSFSLTISEEVRCLNGNIAPFSLQMLVENALKHNVHTKQEPLNITIFTDKHRICVSNSKNRLSYHPSSTNLGNHNLQERYSILSGDNIKIEDSKNYYLVSLPIL
ncbi:MAG: histidine kinase [Bacteroidales bacterium]|nr:histidine kinase [Bacteroidales bacterium]